MVKENHHFIYIIFYTYFFCIIENPCTSSLIPRFDFVIIGAGVAGPILARRLSENPGRKVLLIEAGPEEPTMTAIPGLAFNGLNTSLDWNFKTEPTIPHPTACLGIEFHLLQSSNIMSILRYILF